MPAIDANSMHIRNSQAIKRLSEDEMRQVRGKYAILVDGKIESLHATNRDALEAACAKYRYGQFSVQRIEPQPIDMGFTDCANYPR